MAAHSELITSAELAKILGQPNLRVFDCTTALEYLPPGSDMPYNVVPGWKTFEAGHVPGADFLDLQGEFSDQHTKLRFMMPEVAQLEAAFGRHGVGTDSFVVLYSIGTAMWATRFWWMLKSLGFDNIAVLDGGWDKWKAEGRTIESGPAKGYPPAKFIAKPRAGYFVHKHQVLAARGDRGSIVVNALNAQLHKGQEPSRYGRPGHIPGSCNVSAATLVDPDSKTFVPLAATSAWSPIVAAAFRRPSISSCCTGSATTSSRSTTARWANGRPMNRCRLKPVKPAHSDRARPSAP
jgi:thiosulfate/3-mercaptopyruvate sulfurtransferase